MTNDTHTIFLPYLFNAEAFNKALYGFGLSSLIVYDNETVMPDQLAITSLPDRSTLLLVPFGRTLMIQGDNLFYWETDTNLVDIVQIGLKNMTSDPWILNTKTRSFRFSYWQKCFRHLS